MEKAEPINLESLNVEAYSYGKYVYYQKQTEHYAKYNKLDEAEKKWCAEMNVYLETHFETHQKERLES